MTQGRTGDEDRMVEQVERLGARWLAEMVVNHCSRCWSKLSEKARTRIIMPTPVMSELLIYAGAGTGELVARLTKSATFRVMPFDTRAAIELAVMTRAAIDQGDKRGGVDAPWNKIKFDRQIVAIAKVADVTAIYSDDRQLRTFAETQDLTVIGLADLPLPPQPELPLPPPSGASA